MLYWRGKIIFPVYGWNMHHETHAMFAISTPFKYNINGPCKWTPGPWMFDTPWGLGQGRVRAQWFQKWPIYCCKGIKWYCKAPLIYEIHFLVYFQVFFPLVGLLVATFNNFKQNKCSGSAPGCTGAPSLHRSLCAGAPGRPGGPVPGAPQTTFGQCRFVDLSVKWDN